MNNKAVTIDGFEDVIPFDEKALQKAVANQPVSVAIEASGMPLQFYQSVSVFKTFLFIFFAVESFVSYKLKDQILSGCVQW